MKRFTFSTIHSNLTFWFLILALLPLIVVMFITYKVRTQTFEETTYEKLSAIRDLKVLQVESWLNERKGDFGTFIKNTDKKILNEALKENKSTRPDNSSKDRIRSVLHNYQNTNPIYENMFIINRKTGIVAISSDPAAEGHDRKDEACFLNAIISDKIVLGEIFYSPETGNYLLPFSLALHASAEKTSEITGVLVAYIDLKNSLYSVLLNRTGLGKTGETLILNKDRIALNELRWYEKAPLQLHLNTLPALYSSQGKTGVLLAYDYRGVKVLSAYTYIPDTGWGFVCKQDWSELNESNVAMNKFLMILLILSAILIVVIVYFVSISISSPIVELNTDTQKIASGDYTVRNSVKSHNELGRLGESINFMVKSIESRVAIEKGVSAISEAMIGHLLREQYADKTLKQLLKVTGADMAVFYALNEQETEFEPFDSIGADKKLLEPFLAEKPEGEPGIALAQKNIHHLKNLPADTRFRYKTSAGEIIPREFITIPVKNNTDKVIAFISLVSVSRFSAEVPEMLQQSWNVINTSYTNLVVSEQTAILASTLLQSNQKLEAQAEELQEQSEELQHQARELQKSSDELLMQNQELEMQRIQVEETTRLKSEFLSNMSHELRTPLNSINALSHVLIRQASHKLSAEENEYLIVVERNGKRLLALINDILDLSKVEAGKIELQPRPLSLNALINQVADNLQPLVKQKNIAMTFESPGESIDIETDESRLDQVLVNVIGNAVKFTDKGGVTISLSKDEKAIHIEVKDTGIGISQDAIPYIFDEFRQVDGSTSRSYEGTGLGLAIANKLVHALHGKIAVESTLGKGSAFTISLPLKWEWSIEPEIFSPSIQPEADQLKKTILVVDDDPKIVKQISSSLDDAGYHTIGTTSGKEALKLAGQYKPYAITLDIVMPDMDGLEVLQYLKSNPETTHIPVIVISISDDKQASLALGAVGYITKPVDRQALIREIRKLNPNPATIMIVDDNPVDRRQIHDILQKENMYDIEAESGPRCLELLRIHQPDVLVLDLVMPGMDGFEVLDVIRKKPETRDLPVIVVTAKDLTSHDREILSGKVSTVLNKSSMAPEKILVEIKRILAQIEDTKLAVANPVIQNPIKRILIVEDNEIAVIQVKKILEKEGLAVDVASDGKHALEYVQHTIPDGIILDLMMPGINGFELLEIIRNTKETRKLPVLILTAKNLTKHDLSRLSANNVQQLIQKGDVNPLELLNKVKTMLGIDPLTGSVNVNSDASHQHFIQPSESVRDENDKRPRILVVEDNTDNRLTIRAILGEKYIVAEANSGEEGLLKTRSELPDLVLLDISLPIMNGLEVVKLLKNNDATKHIPVIALTAKAMKNDRETIIEAGCDEYVAKPIDQEELITKIERLL